jgi:saccharopine dehydrogenase-like NADP-dependent oxidoreductase
VKSGKILVIGGYGNVGRIISTALADRFPGRVVAAGRNYQKAWELSLETQQRVLPLELDVFSTYDADNLLDGVALVVMCIDQRNTEFVEQCIQRGIHYVDITASYEFLSMVELLDADSKRRGATVVLSVGLIPGLTNLLASHCRSVLGQILHADIFVMLGLGEEHGEAAIRWTIDNLNSEFLIRESGDTKQVRSFGSGKKTSLPGQKGVRTAYRFNFSDQHVIPRTLSIDSVSTWLCFDSAVVTTLLALLRRVGFLIILRFETMRNLFTAMLRALHFGSDQFAVKVSAFASTNGQQTSYECSITGHNEGRTTGLVATIVAEQLYSSSPPAGVFHIEQLFDPLDFITKLDGHGLAFSRKAN